MEDRTYPIPTEPRRRDEKFDLPDVVFERPLTLSQLLEVCKERDIKMRISFEPITNTLEIYFERYFRYSRPTGKALVTLNLLACEAACLGDYIAFHITEAINSL